MTVGEEGSWFIQIRYIDSRLIWKMHSLLYRSLLETFYWTSSHLEPLENSDASNSVVLWASSAQLAILPSSWPTVASMVEDSDTTDPVDPIATSDEPFEPSLGSW